ncbi:O-antigen/teichoic acid export membrane protein [Cerasibacillus quisquiliarum]|uniref:Polyhydroxyalkanoate synthase n=1 Tax=Cerasibacillus quisquiliarum TaxID=227865 RepID=A0A511UU57_9BACI|nr:oligosaccharide flippase family protein [Cerasibacillus quisquiliarum]MBB5144969.1 O-antigen/teichoic acid export membrane protein [Cerasibacillus quisquiliarum]GEN30136.1 polyhydroxyalkanoate synthase [Cerasibacillus quisquiliarum]
MKEKTKELLNSKFIKNVTIMATGAAGAQAIAMLLSPFITRIYGPEAYGIMGTFTSIISIIAPVAALTYPIAIVLPKSDLDAKGLIRLSLIITGTISFVSLLLITLFNKQIANVFNLNEVSSFLFLIPLVIIFGGLMQVSEQWLIRTKQFSINAKVTFWQSVIINSSKVGIGFFYPFASVLVILTVFANGLRAVMMIFFAKKSSHKKNMVTEDRRKSLRKLAREYYDFPLYRAPEVFLNAVSNGLPVLMLTSFFGTAAAGFYTIGRTVLSIPSRLIGKAVGDVFYPRIAEAAKEGENVTNLIKKATLALSGVGIVPFGLIVLFGPKLFSFVFGSDWVVAGEYARWIALWSFFAFMNRPSVMSLPVLNAQRFHLIYTVIMLVTRLSALAMGYFVFESDIVAVALFGISGAILNFGLITITLRISKKKTRLV